MLQYLTPSTLVEIYKNLLDASDEFQANNNNRFNQFEYNKLMCNVMEVAEVYKSLTGEEIADIGEVAA